MSLPEVLLWIELQKRPGGFKWRKQHPAGPFTADFFCHRARLILEIDGEAHDRGDQPHRDAQKDAWLAARRFRVLRIPAIEVLKNLDGVLTYVITQASQPPGRRS